MRGLAPLLLVLALVACDQGPEPLPPDVEARLELEELEALEAAAGVAEPRDAPQDVEITIRPTIEPGVDASVARLTWATVPQIGEPLRARVVHGSERLGDRTELSVEIPRAHALLELAVDGPGIAPRRVVALLPRNPADDVSVPELRVGPEGVVAGVVRAPDGSPATDATVYLIDEHLRALLVFPSGSVATALGELEAVSASTDDAGEFEAKGLVPGTRYTVVAEAPGEVTSAPLALEAGAASDVELRLRRPGRLVVAVHTPDEQTAATQVRIERPLFPPRVAERLAGGEFVFPALPPGSHDVQVRVPDHLPLDATVEVASGDERTVEVFVESGARLGGTVLDETDSPVRFARVVLLRDGHEVAKGKTDVDGAFELLGLADGEYALEVEPAAHTRTSRTVSIPSSSKLELVVQRFGGVRVDVPVGSRGRPPGRIHVAPVLENGELGRGRSRAWSRDGVLIDELPAGPQTLAILVEGAPRSLRQVTVVPGDFVDLGRVEPDAGRSLTGRVIDATGAGVADVLVEHGARLTPEEQRVRTDAQGRFELTALPDLALSLRFSPPAGAPFERSFESSRADVEVRLPPLGTLRLLRHRTGDGLPLVDQRFTVTRIDDGSNLTHDLSTDAFGAAEIRLPAGRYRIDGLPDLDDPEVELGAGQNRTLLR